MRQIKRSGTFLRAPGKCPRSRNSARMGATSGVSGARLAVGVHTLCNLWSAVGTRGLGRNQVSKMNKRRGQRGLRSGRGRGTKLRHKTFILESLFYFQPRRLEPCRLITDSKAPSPATETQPRFVCLWSYCHFYGPPFGVRNEIGSRFLLRPPLRAPRDDIVSR